MGNRAIIVPEGEGIGVYLHWNGGRDSVEAFLAYCKLKGYRPFGGKGRDSYGVARFTQVVCNFFGGGLSVGVQPMHRNEKALKEDAEWLDNGIYIVGGESGWDIVRRIPEDMHEQREYDLTDMLEAIDEAQPKAEQLGKEFLHGKTVPSEELKPGDVIFVHDELNPKCRKRTIKGVEKRDGWTKGKMFYMEYCKYDKKQHRQYLTAQEYRMPTV